MGAFNQAKGDAWIPVLWHPWYVNRIQEFLIGGPQGFPKNVRYVEGKLLEVDGNSYYYKLPQGALPSNGGCLGGLPQKKIEKSAFWCFAMVMVKAK